MILQTVILSLAMTSPHSLLEDAETAFAAENWSEAALALDSYIQEANVPSPEAMYDRGIAHYNLGEFEVAAQAFDNAMEASNDTILKSYSAFNLGNAVYNKTMQQLEGTGTEAPSDEDLIALEDAQKQIKQVLQSYRSAIASDATDMDARANGELAWQMLQQLDQMQEQMEEEKQKQEQQQQDDQQDQEQNDESADQEEDNQEKKDDGSSDEEQQKKDSEQSDQQQDGEQSEQKQDGEQSEQDHQDSEQSEEQQDGEQSDQGKQQESDEQQFEQTPKDGELESTDENMNKGKDSPSEVKEEGERLSESEADRLLQLIRDKEQQRRKALAARRAENRTSTGKDW